MKKLMLLFVAVFALALCMTAQNRRITGTVVGAEDDEPLIGATVMPIGGGTGTATDIDGHFTLNVPPSCKELRVTYVGMHEATVPAQDGVTVKLVNSTNRLDEVMVVAYGTAKRSEYTGAAGVVSASEMENALVSTATDALAGKVSGVQVQSYNGQPGAAPTVRIRGVGSINANSNPLYVVDGLPYEGDISLINTQDIESMTVLKDAASTSLYGARGANGVILVTTKRGANDSRAKVTVDARWGANSRAVGNYDLITDTDQYMQILGQAIYNQSRYNLNKTHAQAMADVNSQILTATGYQIYTLPQGQNFFVDDAFTINPLATLGYSDGQYYYTPDNWDDGTYRNGFRQEYNISVSGGTDKFNYYLSGAYLDDQGLIQGSHFKRLSTRAKVDYQVKSWLKIGTNLAYTYTNSGYPASQTKEDSNSSTNAFSLANTVGPVYPMYVRDASGSIMYDPNSGKPIYDYGSKDVGYTNFTRNYFSGSNPVGSLLYNTTDYLTDFFNGKWFATLTPIEGLNVTGTVGYLVDNTRLHYLLNGLYGPSKGYQGKVEQQSNRDRSIELQAMATYSRTFNDVHNASIMVAYESLDRQWEFLTGSGSNTYNPGLPFLSNTIDQKDNEGYQFSYATRGIILNAKYNYDSRYFFTAGYRRDASSRFAKDNRWGNFWSVSGAWDAAKEKFLQDVTWLDMLKVRASFGQNGNDNLGTYVYDYYAYADVYRVSGGEGVWNDAVLANKGNPDISWETSNSFNAGVDFSFLNGRLDGSIDYFNRQTKDMLYFKPTSPSLGYSSMPMNVGSMRNNGLEIDLNVNIFNTKDFAWDLNGNITFAWNKVLKLHPDLNGEWISGNRIFREGESMYQLYLIPYAGVDPTSGMALYWDKNEETGEEFLSTSASDAYSHNRKATGNLMPKGYGGFGTKVRAYGFDLSVSFAYQFGGRILDYSYHDYMNGCNQSQIGHALHKDMLNAWTPANPNTDVPRLSTGDQYPTGSSITAIDTDRWLVSSNYLSLNNITLGYNFSDKVVSKLGLSELRIYGVAENVALWSARKGLDPRQDFVNSSNATYSPSRCISGGIRVAF